MNGKHAITLLGSTAIWLGASGAALAELTPQDVWEGWMSYAESIGQTISVGSETASGDTLTLNDVRTSIEFPDGGSVAGTLDMIQLQGRSDGTVAISMSPDYPFSISAEPEDGKDLDMGIILRQTGMSLIASGQPGNIDYDYTASAVSFDVDRMFVDGEEVAPTINFTVSDIDGKYSMEKSDLRTLDSTFNAGSMDFTLEFEDPENGGTISAKGRVEDLASESSGTLPLEIDPEDPAWVFGDDFRIAGTYTAGASDYTMTANNGAQTFSADGGSESSSLTFSMADGMVAYGGEAGATEYRLSGSEIPFPELTIGLQDSAFDFKMPIQQTEEPADFALLTSIRGLTVSDEIWSMFDPGNVLPRDPATLVIDLTGKLKWLLDMSDPESIADEASPAELHALSIDEIILNFAGASVEGTGDFTFDPTDTTTFDGMPAPTGEANFTIVGANSLIDKLIQMGLMPDDQAMGARMMLGMFARPGDGEDTLVSKIEVKPDGQVTVNGQRIQ